VSFRFRSSNILFCLLCLTVVLSLQAQDQPEKEAPQRPASVPLSQPLPAPPAPNTRDRFVKEDDFSIGIFGFMGFGAPLLEKGHAATFTEPGQLDFGGTNQVAPGVLLVVPAGKGSTVQLSYFQARGAGSQTLTQDSAFWSVGYANGDYVQTSYKLRNAKVSWNYLTLPFPSTSGKFRLKTLWEVQFTDWRTKTFAPLKATTDANGNYVEVTGEGSKTVFLPTLGLALEHRVSPHFRWEVKASGMGYPHRSAIWDANAYVAYRRHSWELVVGAKGFHAKTSPRKEQILLQTLAGGYFGINWYL
jgi:hypothetical protein